MAKTETVSMNSILRLLPSIDELLATPTAVEIAEIAGSARATALARTAADSVRAELLVDGDSTQSEENLLAAVSNRLDELWRAQNDRNLQRVVNATGVIIHTNLGRAPLSDAAVNAIAETAAGYCTLEYDLETGKRGKRGGRVEEMIAELTGAEAGLVVNNCAAAAYLVLTVLARGCGVIVSRGELVEIGGDFRIPDVLVQSGCDLREVGTTNRTKLKDYETAIDENTKLILRVHPSNYRIIGFTESPSIGSLADLAHSRGLLLYEDAGSGALTDLAAHGLKDEPVISLSISEGADIVTFSGDKLLGGPQAGLIVGRKKLVDQIRKHPLYRALRVDKLAYAALGATLASYSRDKATDEIPVMRMLSVSAELISDRVHGFVKAFARIGKKDGQVTLEIVEGASVVGGGSAPGVHPNTVLISLASDTLSAHRIEELLRRNRPPVIARIVDEKVVIDLRTVNESEEAELMEAIVSIAKGANHSSARSLS